MRPWLLAVWIILLLWKTGLASSTITVRELETAGEQGAAKTAADKARGPAASRAGFAFEESDPTEGLKPSPSNPEESGDCAVIGNRPVLPRIAIIIDDMGYHHQVGDALLALGINLTFSFLPHGPFTVPQEEEAWRQGRDILVHMPMEARDPLLDPGPGTLYLTDQPETLVHNVEWNLASVPHAVGVNNHMGSRFTEDKKAMELILGPIKHQGLFFIDSSTSSRSIAMETARSMGIRTARRQVFLDNVHNQEDICRQLKLLIAQAVKRGWAIGIGHPNDATLAALTKCREMLRSQVQIVGVHELVR